MSKGDESNSAVGLIEHLFQVMTNAEGQRSGQYRVCPAKHAVEVQALHRPDERQDYDAG